MLVLRLTATFNNMQTLNFKAQLTNAFFTAVSHPFRGFKRSCMSMVCDWWISILFCFCFRGLLVVIVVMIEGRENTFFS